ncbi:MULTISPECIES: hypothetical protein [Colwellia]|uniref:hypothetical protein n=1 Tax=Colwellia TaxID=28228 RepID=UPI000A40A17C|nr:MULTISPECIES: hypothetical protein [Colwellia]
MASSEGKNLDLQQASLEMSLAGEEPLNSNLTWFNMKKMLLPLNLQTYNKVGRH